MSEHNPPDPMLRSAVSLVLSELVFSRAYDRDWHDRISDATDHTTAVAALTTEQDAQKAIRFSQSASWSGHKGHDIHLTYRFLPDRRN